MELVFRDDAYARACEAAVTAVSPAGIALDRTVFYPTGGGQPGDTGRLVDESGAAFAVLPAVKGAGDAVLHPLPEGAAAPPVGARVRAEIDWERRYRHMRMHTCLHLLSAVVAGGVTGGAVGEWKSRLDFDLPDPVLDREALGAALNALIEADHPVVAALDRRGRARRQPRAGAHHVGAAAARRGPRARAGDRPGRGPPALRRHPCRADGRDRARAHRQDREEGPAQPAHQCPSGGGRRMSAPVSALISTGELARRLGDVVVLDGSHHLPTAGRDAGAEFLEAHIPGARFFDIDGVADKASALPHMLPDEKGFALAMGAMGIGRGDEAVVYDTVGTTGAARVWWTFRAFGHERVRVLDGGLPKWRAEGRPVEAGYEASARPALVRAREDMLANIESRAEQVLDARSAGRFAGTEPEPRAGMRSGHIPGSLNLPYTELLDPGSRAFRDRAALRAAFEAAGLDLEKPVATTCGSGITAAVLALGLYELGHTDAAVYDGSWSEWGSREDTPVEP